MLDPQRLADCIVHWLSEKAQFGIADTFSEYSLAIPIAEFAVKSGFSVRVEVVNSAFKTARKGRGERTDFVLAKDDQETAIETKFLKQKSASSCQKYGNLIISDVFRLAIAPNYAQRLLVLVFDFLEDKDFELSKKWSNRSGWPTFFADWLGNKAIEVGNCTLEQMKFCRNFKVRASRSRIRLPSGYRSERLAVAHCGNFTAVIWNIMPHSVTVM